MTLNFCMRYLCLTVKNVATFRALGEGSQVFCDDSTLTFLPKQESKKIWDVLDDPFERQKKTLKKLNDVFRFHLQGRQLKSEKSERRQRQKVGRQSATTFMWYFRQRSEAASGRRGLPGIGRLGRPQGFEGVGFRWKTTLRRSQRYFTAQSISIYFTSAQAWSQERMWNPDCR